MTDAQLQMLRVLGALWERQFYYDADGDPRPEFIPHKMEAIPLPGKVDTYCKWGGEGYDCDPAETVTATRKYTTTDFVQHMEDVFEDVLDTLVTKGNEYAQEEDTFATLKQVAKAWGELPRKVALKLALKHYMSLLHEGDNLSPMQRRDRLNDIHVYIEMAELNWEEK